MPSGILVTGAAGYIGSIVSDFLAGHVVEEADLIVALRCDEQAVAQSKVGIKVLQLDLTNEGAVVKTLCQHNIDIVIHCASSLDPSLALPLITALSKRKEASGEKIYFIHLSTSVLSAFYERTGWPHGPTEDTGPVFDQEKQLADSFPIRKTVVTIVEYAKARGVTNFIVIPSTVYGKGTGERDQLSAVLPTYYKATLSQKKVYKFAENTVRNELKRFERWILTNCARSFRCPYFGYDCLYRRIVEKVLQQEELPNGTEGYNFALAHDLFWWKVLDYSTAALDARGLIIEKKPQIWAGNEEAAEVLGVQIPFVQPL